MNILFAAIIAPLLSTISSTAPNYSWSPLDAAEIADAHPCFVGVPLLNLSIIAICAGGKRIDTGFRFSPGKGMTEIDPKLPDIGYMLPQASTILSTVIESELLQKEDSDSPAWEEHYYLMTREQLDQYVRASGGKSALITPP